MKTIYKFEIEIVGNGFQKTIGPLERDEALFKELEKTIESFYDPESIDVLKLFLPGMGDNHYITIPSVIFRTTIVTLTLLDVYTKS